MKQRFYALVSGHIYVDEDGDTEIEILHQVDTDEAHTEIFCDIDHALLDEIDIGENNDYYFMAFVESQFVEERGLDYVEYEVEHVVTEIKHFQDLKNMQCH